MTFGFDFEWSLEWSVSLSHLPTYLPIRDWDLIYVAPGTTAEILRHPVTAECRPGFVAGDSWPLQRCDQVKCDLLRPIDGRCTSYDRREATGSGTAVPRRIALRHVIAMSTRRCRT